MAVNPLLRLLIEREGSDLHLSEGLVPRGRVHGILEDLAGPSEEIGAWILAILDEGQRRALEEDGETDFAYEVEGAARFRVNAFKHAGGLGAVFRVIPQIIPTLEELRIPDEVRSFTRLERGLVLVTGPTGSGKSSTLAALLDVINETSARHIITIENPIEFVHTDKRSTFTQREVGRDTDSFAQALLSAARQDPDLVLVGEMRDRETIHLALSLAEMGVAPSTASSRSSPRTSSARPGRCSPGRSKAS